MANRIVFLPGASGDPTFWAPVAARLSPSVDKVLLAWPGFGATPANPRVRTLSDLRAIVAEQLTDSVDLVAQSMGGVIALQTALQWPERVKHLVLTATSGGVDLSSFQPQDWRAGYRQEFPETLLGFVDDRTDVGQQLPTLRIPTLLLWGDADSISPVAVGRYLAGLLPDCKLVIIPGSTHMMARVRAEEIAPLIAAHLAL